MTASSQASWLRAHWWTASAVLVGAFIVFFVAGMVANLFGASTYTYFDNITETVAAFAGAAACGVAAWHHHRRLRLAWALMACSALCWGLGQTVWNWYQLVQNVQTPFPSFADAGYLGMVPFAVAAVLAFPVAYEQTRTHIRSVLDGLLIVAGFLVVSWTTVLGAVYQAGADSTLAMVLSLLYPLSDVAIVSIILLRVGRVARGSATPLLLLAAGLVAAAVADSNFAYQTANNTYGAGSPLDAGWVAGYVLIALAALRSVHSPMRADAPHVFPSRFSALLPYPPVAAALGVAIAEMVRNGAIDRFTFWTMFALVALVLVRQYLVVTDNARLMQRLTVRERELDHQANHDSLTGLPNRAYFTRQVARTLEENRSTGARCAVLFLDLDDFKQVNDLLGHATGDRVLRAVASRMRGALRPLDLASRFGGDEFAMLIDRITDESQLGTIASRVLAALREPLNIDDFVCSTRGTMGMALSEPDTDDAEELLRRADVAMYAAKRAGKDRIGVYPAMAA
ncbi:MAG: GGDEF domain-containing protein [Candidatus Dormibacteraeota bacterium]|nr:GGDEF domain-containing protein [Candidatus Dormibacteraeota bacterium]